MGDHSTVLGISLFILTVSMISLSGGAELFVFNFDYQNTSVGGEEINVGIEDAEEYSTYDFVYYDADVDKLRVNTTALENQTGGTPRAYFTPNITGVESYEVNAEVPDMYYMECGGTLEFSQGFIDRTINDGSNTFTNQRDGRGDFEITWNRGLFPSEECIDTLYESNITEVTAEFPTAADAGALDMVQQFTTADSGYEWFNYIVMGSIGIIVGYIVITWLRGN